MNQISPRYQAQFSPINSPLVGLTSPQRVSDIVIRDFVTGWQTTTSSAFSVLSAREGEVLQLMAEGRTTNQIADGLCVSVKTVEAHRKQVMTKLGIHSVAELTKYAIRQGLTSMEV